MAEPWDMRNMNLNEYQKAIKADSNLWWRLSSGTQLNLLDEAIDQWDKCRRLLRECVEANDNADYYNDTIWDLARQAGGDDE